MMSRDPSARRGVRTYRQIEAEFRKLDKKEEQVRTKYEPVQKGDPTKEAGASHRFANVLVWEDDISVFRNIGKSSRTGEHDIRPGTAPTLNRALHNAFSPEVLPDEVKRTFRGKFSGEDSYATEAHSSQKPRRRWSADPRRNSHSSRYADEEQDLRLDPSLGATHGSIGASPDSLPNPKSIPNNGIIHRRPPSGSIATARARRIMSAKHFRPLVTQDDGSAPTVGDLQVVNAEYFKTSRRPESARPVRRKPQEMEIRDPTAEPGYSPFQSEGERREMAGRSSPLRQTYTNTKAARPPSSRTRRPSTAHSQKSSQTPESGGRTMSARSHGSRTMSARSHSTAYPENTWSRMSHTTGENSIKAPALATDEDINRGIQGLMEAGQSSRHERAIKSAKKDMWESIATTSGVPVPEDLEFAWDPYLAPDDDEVVIGDNADEVPASSPVQNDRYAGCTEVDELEQIREDETLSTALTPEHDHQSQFSSREDVQASPPLRPQSAAPRSERTRESSASVLGHASVQGSIGGKSSHSSAREARQRPMTAPAKRRPENTGAGRSRNPAQGPTTRTSHWRSSMSRSKSDRPKTRTAENAQNRASAAAGAAAAAASAPPQSPSPTPVTKSEAARRDMIMRLMVSGIRSQQPEDGPELECKVKGIELQDRDSMEFPVGMAQRLQPSSPAPMWVLSSEDPIEDMRSVLMKLPGGSKDVQRLQAGDEPINSARVSRDASRSLTGTAARGGSAPAHLSHEFYNLEVSVGPDKAVSSQTSMADWRFDVTVKQVDGDGPSACVGRNLRVNKKNQVLFRPAGNENPTIFSPVDSLPWVTSPEQLFRKTLQIVVVSTTPQIREVLDTTVWLGPWDEEPELVTIAPSVKPEEPFNFSDKTDTSAKPPPVDVFDTESLSSSMTSRSPSPKARSRTMKLPSSVEGLTPPRLESKKIGRKLSGAGGRPASAKADPLKPPDGYMKIPCSPGSPSTSRAPSEAVSSAAPYDAVSLTSNRQNSRQRAQSTSSGMPDAQQLVSAAAASIDDLLESRDEIVLKLRSMAAGQELPVTKVGTVVMS